MSNGLLKVKLCPIWKDKSGDKGCADNYKLVAAASSLPKLFEFVLLDY